ncbi:MAG: aldo/keto reductase [Phycisphaeraceae bacterium]|nr:aldo/keto reductase [Phycisphaeraceae bacterium]
MPSHSRRDFLKHSAAATFAASAIGAGGARAFAAQPEGEKPMPTPTKPAKVEVERRKFGKTDMTVAILGFGSAEIGYERTDQAVVDGILNAALDQGLNVVDTAECYIDAEEQIGRAISHRRKEFYLFTKCGHVRPDGSRGDDWSKAGTLASIERSLVRCKTDVLDLIQLHSCSLDTLKKGECIEALEEAKKQGKVRYIGYSGDSQAAKWAIESGKFDALQTSINIADQECVELTLPLAQEKNMGVVAKRPIANAAWRYDTKPDNGYHVEYWNRLQALKYPFATGDKRQDTGPDGAAGTALRFSAFLPGVHVCIVGTSRPERWRQNAELLRAGPLSAETMKMIRDRWKEAAKPDWTGQT